MNDSQLLHQASTSADDYLRAAIESIDARLGKDYASKHPEVIAAFMRTAAQDFHTAIFMKKADALADAVRAIADSLATDEDEPTR